MGVQHDVISVQQTVQETTTTLLQIQVQRQYSVFIKTRENNTGFCIRQLHLHFVGHSRHIF